MTMADTMVEVHNPAGTAAVKCKTSEIPDGWLRSWDNTIAGKKAALEAPKEDETEAEELARMKAELADLEEEAIKVDGNSTSEDEDDDEDGMKALQREIEDEEAAKAASEDSVESGR